MMRALVIGLLLICGISLAAQSVDTDNLALRASFWWQADSLDKGPSINGHPSALANAVRLPEQLNHSGALSVFTIYVPDEKTEEQLLWSLAAEEQLKTVLTTHRLAQLQRGDFRNFQDTTWVPARLHSYYARLAEEDLALSFLPTPPAHLPVQGFGGSLAEVIVFDAVLSPLERQRVETYLALKYGLTLAADYLDRSGNTIQPIVDADHKWRVAGLGNDPFFSFRSRPLRDCSPRSEQNQSQSIFAPDFLQLSTLGQLDPGAYLVVADNDAPLSLSKPGVLQPLTAERSWQLTATQWSTDDLLHLEIDTSAFPSTSSGQADQTNYHWWVRHSAEGVPASYAPMVDEGEERPVFLLSIPASTGTSKFQMVYGPALIPNVELSPPTCAFNSQGEVRIAAAGLHFPVQYSVYNELDLVVADGELSDAEDAYFINLNPGEYQLFMEDDIGTRFSESWFFQASDAPAIHLEDAYYFSEGEGVDLSTTTTSDTELEWRSASGDVLDTAPDFHVGAPGQYELRASRDGCEARHVFTADLLRENDNIADLSLWPNPSSDGYFQLRADLHQAASAEVELVDVAGRVLHRQALSEVATRHTFAGRVLQKGFYFVHFKTRESSAVRKLVVE